uniref:Chemokine interleukin-8-like domain-containing protein n=1 Tax=Pundamilia nyererei TaxID=303518 RepID=A0A3B4F0S2_9CICH
MLKSIRFLLLSVQLLSQIFGAVNSPDFCCFDFFDKRIPKANIVSINKTHSQCSTPAFTPKRLFCVKQDEDWAVREFVKRAQ